MLTMQTNLDLLLSCWLVQLQDPYLLDLLQEHQIHHQEVLLLAVAAWKACLGLQAPFDLINRMISIQWALIREIPLTLRRWRSATRMMRCTTIEIRCTGWHRWRRRSMSTTRIMMLVVFHHGRWWRWRWCCCRWWLRWRRCTCGISYEKKQIKRVSLRSTI